MATTFLVAAGVLLVGCKDAPSVGTVRRELEQQIPGAEFEHDFQVSLGRVTLGMVKGVAKLALEEDEGEAAMRHIKRVDVGVYSVVSLPPLDEIRAPRSLAKGLDGSGWSLTVQVRDEFERVWVFTRQDSAGGIRNIYVVALDEAELTMVSLEGRLDRMLADLVAEDPDGFISGLGV
jgi:hypothetical protein